MNNETYSSHTDRRKTEADTRGDKSVTPHFVNFKTSTKRHSRATMRQTHRRLSGITFQVKT